MNSEIIRLIGPEHSLLLAYTGGTRKSPNTHWKKTTVIALDNKSDSSGRETYYFPIVELNPEDIQANSTHAQYWLRITTAIMSYTWNKNLWPVALIFIALIALNLKRLRNLDIYTNDLR